MKKRSFWSVTPAILVMAAALLAVVAASLFWDIRVFCAELAVAAAVLLFVGLRLRRLRQDVARYIGRIVDALDHSEQAALAQFPLPAVVISDKDEILWYNDSFRGQVLDGAEVYGCPAGTVTGGAPMRDIRKKKQTEILLNDRRYTVFVGSLGVRESTLYMLYYVDVTRLKEIEREYELSRPAVVTVYIDNVEELMQNVRDSERAQVIGRVETLLEDWVSAGTGILRKYNSDRFQIVMEQRQLQRAINSKFDILDRVRALPVEGVSGGLTLSIGVGQGETLRESESMARQAIDMALGRGGDQAAVKTKNGFDFYGGVSKGVEKRTKVRTRVVASALQELIEGSDNVILMGHGFSDLDCVGSCAALAVLARSMGKPAFVAVSHARSLAKELLERYEQAGRGDLFVEPDEALTAVGERTLLIVTDTHNPKMLESPEVYEAAKTVVVIDHHRKMVEHIDNAMIFYHEPYASSASEMVAELLQYMGDARVARPEAEALLAGIMLDTRSFVMKSGVRTFEAAAYLRRQGADTVEVKRLFAGSMETYRRKSELISHAELYHGMAIAAMEQTDGDWRIAAAQAADELLSIKGVDAAFTLFCSGDPSRGDRAVNISARSFGAFNVQLVMEAIGGGGHLNMAGAQLRGVSMEEALQRLRTEIDRQLEERSRSLAAQAKADIV